MPKPAAIVLTLGLAIAAPAHAAPVVLSPAELDAVTAGGAPLSVSILAQAAAQGTIAYTTARSLAVERPNIDFATAIAIAFGTNSAETAVLAQASGGTVDLTGARSFSIDGANGAFSISYGYAIAANSAFEAYHLLGRLMRFSLRVDERELFGAPFARFGHVASNHR